MLVLHDNISLERVLKMYCDDKKFYDTKNQYTSYREYIKSGIKSHLKDFWSAQGLLRSSSDEEIIDFVKKYQKTNVFKKIGMWIKTHITVGPE
jgi:hypothetical protein